MRPHLFGTLALSGLVSCSSGRVVQDTPSTGMELDDSDRVYDASHLMQVEIVIDPDDWDRLRNETRTLADTLAAETCGEEPFESPLPTSVGRSVARSGRPPLRVADESGA